ncbi:hypothetical protein V8C42DRAFT_303935 [Trichoderma barbatum]
MAMIMAHILRILIIAVSTWPSYTKQTQKREQCGCRSACSAFISDIFFSDRPSIADRRRMCARVILPSQALRHAVRSDYPTC